jgi:hypothetical protein
MPCIRRTAATLSLLLVTSFLQAQPLRLGEPFPLTNTRYGSLDAVPAVQTNGKDFFLFWTAESNLRVTKLVEGESRAGRHVMTVDEAERPLVTWTGTYFFVVVRSGERTVGQLLDANAEPAGGTFPIFETAEVVDAAASNGRSVLLFHRSASGLRAVTLTPSGAPTGVTSLVLPPGAPVSQVAVASNGDGYVAVVSSPAGVVAVSYGGDGRERWRRQVTAEPLNNSGAVGIGSNGRDYLATWYVSDAWQKRPYAARITADGSVGPAVLLEFVVNVSFESFRVAWTGANWAVAYTKRLITNETVSVAYVHATAPQVVGNEEGGRGSSPSLAVANGRMLMAWRAEFPGAAVASLLPLAGRAQPETASFGSGSQIPIATASTVDSTLVFWSETLDGRTSLHAGVRSANGGWVERRLPNGVNRGQTTVAASDGRDFVMASGKSAVFLDATARLTLGPVPLPFNPHSIAWTGTDYVIANEDSIARLSRSGTVSGRVNLPVRGHILQDVAANGTQLMATLVRLEGCPILCAGPAGPLVFVPLDGGFRPIGEPRFLQQHELFAPDSELIWDGARFLASWFADGTIYVAELPADGDNANVIARIPASPRTTLHMAAVQGGAAIAWRDQDTAEIPVRSRMAVVRHDDSIAAAAFDSAAAIGRPFVAALPNGGTGYFDSEFQDAPPHHGSRRMTLRVAGAALPRKPEPPRLEGMIRDGRVELAWTAPPQDVNGYRIEYRIGDGQWNEIEQWFDANDDAITIAWQVRQGVPYQFRIRALNDAGASEPSAPVLLNVTRRRAVR